MAVVGHNYIRALAVLLGVMAAATLVAVLVGTKPAEAAFPGANGKIAFSSNRTTGTGVDNPTGDFEIFAMNDDGTDLTQLTFNTASDKLPAWSADGAKIAFQSDRDGNNEIYTMDANGSNQTNRTNNPAADSRPAWSPDGTKIVFDSFRDANLDIYRMNADGSSPRRLTKNPANDFEPAWSPDGKQIAFASLRDGNTEIYKMKPKPEGRKNRPINLSKHSTAGDRDPNWSPDGKQIAFRSDRGGDGDDEIYKMNADGTAASHLTENSAFDLLAAWSPDGNQIVFTSFQDGDNAEIFTMDADVNAGFVISTENITNNPAHDSEPDWQPT